MFNFLTKIIFLWKKPKVVVIIGKDSSKAAEAIFRVLVRSFAVKKISLSSGINFESILRTDILIAQSESDDFAGMDFLIKNSGFPILIVSHFTEISSWNSVNPVWPEKAGKLAEIIPESGCLILNFDDETIRGLKNKARARVLTIGFKKNADLTASDVFETRAPSISEKDKAVCNGTNFKVNYKGSIVPIWLNNLFGKESIYAALAAVGTGVFFDLNLVEISQALKKSL